MNKFLGLLFFLMFFSIIAFPQRFEGGIIGGINASQVEGDFASGYNKPGIVAGGYILTNLSYNLFAGMELKLAQKGSRKNPDIKNDNEGKYIMRLNYIDMPVYLGIRTGNNMSLFGGLSAGYLISGIEYDEYGRFQEEDENPFNEFDVQAILGVRADISERLSLDVRLAYSITPIRDQPGEVFVYWLDAQYNNVLSTTLLYRLDF